MTTTRSSTTEAADRAHGWCRWPSCPPFAVVGVVLANELLDNLPFRLARAGATTAGYEVRVGARPTASCPWSSSLVPAGDADAALADRLAPDAAVRVPGSRCSGRRATGWRGAEPWSSEAGWWSSTTRRPPPSWPPARGRSGSAPTGPTARRPPLDALGTQDITCEVDQTSWPSCGRPTPTAPRPSSSPPTASTSWSPRAGASGTERAHIGDLEALRARAGWPRPRRSPTPPASAPSASSSGSWATVPPSLDASARPSSNRTGPQDGPADQRGAHAPWPSPPSRTTSIEDRTFPPSAGVPGRRAGRRPTRSTTRPTPTSRRSGPARPASC